MSFFHAIILGVVEGITEFLPISSTAHLILVSHFLHISQSSFVTLFEVVIQSAAILSVVVLFWKKLFENKKIIFLIAASFVPTAIIGFLMHDMIKEVFFKSDVIIPIALLSMGLIFLVVEFLISKKKLVLSQSLTEFTYSHAFLIGLFQALAIFPGISRAGAVIIGMMLLKYKRTDAALYSFYLAVPTIMAASALDLLKTDPAVFTGPNVQILLVGAVVSAVTAYLSINTFIKYLSSHSLVPFALYRIALAAVLMI